MIVKQKKLLSVDECRALAPLSVELRLRKEQFDKQIKENFATKQKFVVVCGPCSSDSYAPMTDYLAKLKTVADDCCNLLVVARVYTTKPHSNGQGYQGACFHEKESDEVDIGQGIIRCRKMMIRCLELGLPIADELLYPELFEYFSDLVSYWFVGARSSEDTLHRAFASSLNVCCGVKNGTDGSIERLVEGLGAISKPCVYPFHGNEIITDGCKYAHIVLRGGKDENGYFSNVTTDKIAYAKSLLVKYKLNGFIMADLSHANSCKIAQNQINNAILVIKNPQVNGAMVESYLCSGISQDSYGVSKTDECLSFEDTATLLKLLQKSYSQRIKILN